MTIETYDDIKALACLKKIKLDSELPRLFGYTSAWGFKLGLKNPKTKEVLLSKAREIFLAN